MCQKTSALHQQRWEAASLRPHLLPRMDGDGICEQQNDLAIKTSAALSSEKYSLTVRADSIAAQ